MTTEDRVSKLEVHMEGVQSSLSKIEGDLKTVLEIHRQQSDFVINAVPKAKKSVFRAVKKSLAEHDAACPIKNGAGKSIEWPSVIKGLFMAGFGLSVVVGGFLYGFDNSPHPVDGKPPQAQIQAKDAKP